MRPTDNIPQGRYRRPDSSQEFRSLSMRLLQAKWITAPVERAFRAPLHFPGARNLFYALAHQG